MAVLCGVLLAWSSGCQSYHKRTELAFADYERGQFASAAQQYADPKTTDSPFLRGAEAGMSALSGGDFAGARQHFEFAAEAVRQIERTALADPQALGEKILSWAVNDTLLTYEGEGYERALLHSARAIAHLMSGDLEGARVEVRQANALLESEETLYKKEYRAGGLGHFLSGVTYELAGRPDDAYISDGICTRRRWPVWPGSLETTRTCCCGSSATRWRPSRSTVWRTSSSWRPSGPVPTSTRPLWRFRCPRASCNGLYHRSRAGRRRSMPCSSWSRASMRRSRPSC
jgi:hypothetical protein